MSNLRQMKNFSFYAVLLSAILIVGTVNGAVAEEISPCGAPEYECSREPDEANLIRHCCYVNRYGHEEHAPSESKPGAPPPVRALALCRDGYYSFAEHPSGTCSGHHGVQSWMRPDQSRALK
jgi:hypothetical protein